MATQLWEQEIDKTVDWGGDSSTGGAAVSGQYVQKFIKDSLAKKFGYLYYDRDALKYWVFADEDDFNKYKGDPEEYAELRLATFDAPAPASINVLENSNQVVTILSTEKNQKITFKYIVKDSGNNAITESVQARVQFNNGGTVQTYTRVFAVDFDNYKEGTEQSIDIDNYLTVGTNNITLTLTGVSTQASTTLTFSFTVVELNLTSEFNNKQAIVVDESKGVKDNYFQIPFTISGQGNKGMRWYINGKLLNQSWAAKLAPDLGIVQSGDISGVSNQANYSSNFNIYLTDNLGQLYYDEANDYGFKYGKNTLQFYMFIVDAQGNEICSQTKYFDFVITSKQQVKDETYILYSQDLGAGALFKPEDTVEFSTVQYSSTSFKYGLYSSSGQAVNLSFELSKTDDLGNKEIIATLIRSISSGEEQAFEYTFLTYGDIDIIITTSTTDIEGNPQDTLHLKVDVAKSSVQIAVLNEQLALNLEALNRSNTEPNPATWSYRGIEAKFNNVMWNAASGWDGKALVLNNGATVEIPMDVFAQYTGAGLTIELDFETINVQEEDTVVVEYKDPTQKSSFEFTACKANINDGTQALHTNFINDRRLKIAFILNTYQDRFDQTTVAYPNSMFIMVDGILDRALNFNGKSLPWVNPEKPRIIIGDPTAKAGIKVYSIRIYQKALTMDEELTNWIAESDNMLSIYEDNNIYAEGTENISLDIVKNITPTMVIYGDTDLLNNATNKSQNIEGDVEFYNPHNPDLDFFARAAWISCQGTSSMNYPLKNFRLYFGKTVDKKTLDKSKTGEDLYWTEFYRAGEFTHGETSDFSKLGNFQCNKKTAVDKYHKLHSAKHAEILEKSGTQLFVRINGEYYPCSYGDQSAIDANNVYYVSIYRPLRDWLTVKQFRYSGATLYKISGTSRIANPVTGEEYEVPEFEKLKGKKALKEDTTYYVDQACWKQSEVSGWTNRWTLKTDYAESSMCHNSGIARVWGNAMKNVMTSNGYECRTNAQTAMAELADGIDVRTSCDGVPIYMFGCDITRDEQGNPVFDPETGLRKYEPARFLGQFNIMTDKGSTQLFGFEDIYDEKGNKIFSAENVECWEASNNDGEVLKWKTVQTDDYRNSGNDMGYRAVLADNYEPRWPDVEIEMSDGEEALVSHTHRLERLLRFVNFCKPAVDYKVDGMDGYEISNYKLITEDRYQEVIDKSMMVYVPNADSVEVGNITYDQFDYKGDINNLYASSSLGIYEYVEYDKSKIEKTVSDVKIEGHIYKGKAPSFDAKHGIYVEDLPFDDARVDEVNTNYGDTIKGSQYEEDYYVDVYLIQEGGNKFKYINEYGEKVDFTGIRYDDYEKDSKGNSFAGKTYMDYFSEKKYEYWDVPKLAAYYVYLMRFCGVDQSVKNSMLTTEDGTHYYYINYDNDTALGVRNDGNIIYHWSTDRDTIDTSIDRAAYAGWDSVLWNLLEADKDFMNVVKNIDNSMYNSNVLSAKIVLDYLNTYQQGEWCERSYNNQEMQKYLSQWRGSDVTYLKFIHGARNAHRTWFVQNRFNLYDSKWFSGEYFSHKIKMYIGVEGTPAKPVDMFSITAARQSVFALTGVDIDGTVPEDWQMDLAANQTGTLSSKRATNSISGPLSILGVDKIKVLDFRTTTEQQNILLNIIFDEMNTNWFKTKGCMMTGFLLGISDEYRTGIAHRYTNIGDKDETIEVDGESIVIKPGEYYDAKSGIANTPATLKYDIMGATRSTAYGFGGLNEMVTLEEIDIRNVYNDDTRYLLNDFKIDNLPNLHIYRAIGSSITTFEPAEGVILNEVSLPKNRVETITLKNATFTPFVNEFKYKNTTDKDIVLTLSESEVVTIKPYLTHGSQVELADDQLPTGITKTWFEAPVNFKYIPDHALRNVTLKNVVGLDIAKFIEDWELALRNSGAAKEYIYTNTTNASIDVQFTDDITETIAKGDTFKTTINLMVLPTGITKTEGKYVNPKLSLENVNMVDVPVEWLLNTITKFNYSAFTGKIEVLGNGEDGALTEEEYNALVDVYGINAFNASSNLVLNGKAGIFWTINAERITLGDDDVRPNGLGNSVEQYYKASHGVEYTVKATIFPINSENVVTYKQIVYDTTSKNFDINLTTPDKNNPNIQLVNERTVNSKMVSTNGVGKFTSTVTNQQMNRDTLYQIQAIVNGRANRETVYINFDKIILPTVINTSVTCQEEQVEMVNNALVITKEHTHKVSICFADGEQSSLDVDTFTVTTSENAQGIDGLQITNITKANKFDECFFELEPTIKENNVSCTINVAITFKSEYDVAKRGLTLSIPVTVQTIPITDYEIRQIIDVDADGNEVLSESVVSDVLALRECGTTNYRICPLPENYNVKVSFMDLNIQPAMITNTDIMFDETDITKLVVSIDDNKQKSFDDDFMVDIALNPIYSNEINTVLEKSLRIDASIIYPNDFRLIEQSQSFNIEENISLMNDGIDKEFTFNFYVFNNETGLDDYNSSVNYPYTINFKNEQIVTTNYTGTAAPTFTLVKDGNVPTGLHIIIPATKGKSDTIECEIDMWVEYNINSVVKKVERKVKFNIYRTLAFTNTITQVHPGIFDNNELPCLLMDINGNYYKLDSENELLFELNKSDSLKNIIGVVYVHRFEHRDNTADGVLSIPTRCIGLPICNIDEFVNNKLNFLWPSTYNIGNTYGNSLDEKYDNVYSQMMALFAGGGQGSDAKEWPAIIGKLYKNNAGNKSFNSTSILDDVITSGGTTTPVTPNWFPGYQLTEALCADNWMLTKPNSSISFNPDDYNNGRYCFLNVDSACEPIKSGLYEYKLALPNTYQFFKNNFNSPFATDDEIQIGTKCYVGCLEDYDMLERGYKIIINYINMLIDGCNNWQIPVESANTIKTTLTNLISNRNDFLTSSAYSNNTVIGNFALAALKIAELPDELQFNTSTTIIQYGTDNQSAGCSVIPFIRLK